MLGTQERHVRMYRECQEFHRRVLAMSATGRALRRALGEELFARIHWDNANPLHGDTRDARLPPDIAHMMNTIRAQDPDVVLLFGRQAQDGFEMMLHHPTMKYFIGFTVLRAPHPMARGSAIEHLRDIARDLRAMAL